MYRLVQHSTQEIFSLVIRCIQLLTHLINYWTYLAREIMACICNCTMDFLWDVLTFSMEVIHHKSGLMLSWGNFLIGRTFFVFFLYKIHTHGPIHHIPSHCLLLIRICDKFIDTDMQLLQYHYYSYSVQLPVWQVLCVVLMSFVSSWEWHFPEIKT